MAFEHQLQKLTAKEFSKRTFHEQLAVLQAVEIRDKLDYLIESHVGRELLAKLSVQDVYLMVKEIDPNDASELANLISPEHWTGFFDLDCWRGDHFDSVQARKWIQLLLKADVDHIIKSLLGMDFELLILILKNEIMVPAGPEDLEDDDAQLEALQRDGGYQIIYRDEEGTNLFSGLLKMVFEQSADFYRYLLNTLRVETLSMIEEHVYQQRTQRMEDIGFCNPLSARQVYARIDTEAFRKCQHTKETLGLIDSGAAPTFVLTMAKQSDGLFVEMLQKGLNEDFVWELASLVNKVALADQVDYGDQGHLRDTISKVYETLNLSLEWLADRDLKLAEQFIASCYAEELFRVGFNLTLPLQRRSQKFVECNVYNYLDENKQFFVRGLMRKTPLFYSKGSLSNNYELRRFQTLDDLEKANARLASLELLKKLFDGFLFELPDPEFIDLEKCQPDSPAGIKIDILFLTALANQLLGRAFLPTPIVKEELPVLHQAVTEQKRIKKGLIEDVCKWLDGLVPGASAWGEEWLNVWNEEFCPVNPLNLDPRYINGLIVKIDN
ncbi:MAG: hypothetical protein JRD88_04480 [Deltaproteobacteria bacterium]|jgi:hypothetical protein|nr:hypothetical protein [Deltaproteobacteria bacterium]